MPLALTFGTLLQRSEGNLEQVIDLLRPTAAEEGGPLIQGSDNIGLKPAGAGDEGLILG